MEFESIEIVIMRCLDGKIESDNVTVQVIKGTANQVRRQFEELAQIQITACQKQTAVLAYPEAWEVRPEDDRPQLVMIFREKLSNGKLSSSCWSLTIPHYRNVGKPLQPPIPSYRRGNWEMIWVLKDNSKVIMHGYDRSELERMYLIVRGIVHSDYIPTRGPKFGERVAAELPDRQVVPIIARYFPTGRQNLNPLWEAHF